MFEWIIFILLFLDDYSSLHAIIIFSTYGHQTA